MDQEDLEFVRMNPEQSFHDVIQQIQLNHHQIDTLVHTGDLAQVPVERTYPRYLEYMQQQTFPFYQIPGNHDDASCFPFHQQENQAHCHRIRHLVPDFTEQCRQRKGAMAGYHSTTLNN